MAVVRNLGLAGVVKLSVYFFPRVGFLITREEFGKNSREAKNNPLINSAKDFTRQKY